MSRHSIFLSIVLIVKNQSSSIEKILEEMITSISRLVSDFEIIIIDNASTDDSIQTFKRLTGRDGLPNLQVYALTKEVSSDTAICIGLENALGDFSVVFDPHLDSLNILPLMLEKAISGNDVVFATSNIKPKTSFGYNIAGKIFNWLYSKFSGVDLTKDAPQYRLLSKSMINFILQHSHPVISYRHLPATAGFSREYVTYSSGVAMNTTKKLGESIDRGIQLILSTTRVPMRLVTFLCLFGALANLVYSLYVVFIGLFLDDIAEGWISISLQMSGMFFLISLVLLILGEYILHVTSLSHETPHYHIGQELTSDRITRLEKLNLEEPSFFK